MSTFSEKTNAAKRSTVKFLKRLAIVILLVLIGIGLFLYYGTYSDGVRAGMVLKVSKRGAIFKTYEGQLDIMSFGAIKKADNQLTQTFEFSVYKNDTELIEELEEVALNGERVNLHYEEKYVILPWRGETKYFVIEVDRLSNPAPAKQKERFPQ